MGDIPAAVADAKRSGNVRLVCDRAYTLFNLGVLVVGSRLGFVWGLKGLDLIL